jgi:hypothetical protein
VYPTDKDYLEPMTIFRGMPGKTTLVYSFPAVPNASYRGGCSGDFNNDGKVDLVVLPISGDPVLLRNDTPTQNAWIGLRLRGTRSNRDAIGAKVTVEACGHTQFDEVRSGGSYISRNDPRLHFGLGSCSKVDKLTIRWPMGSIQTLNRVAIGKYTTIKEPK